MLKHKFKIKQLMAIISLVVIAFSMMMPAFAGLTKGTTTLRNPVVSGAQSTASGQQATPGPAPPVGDGAIPPAEITGDQGTNPPGPLTNKTDRAQTSSEADFITQPGPGNDRTIIRLYEGGTISGRGNRMVQTIRPDQLPANVASQIAGILGISLYGGQAYTDVIVTSQQLAQIQNLLAPYPQAVLQTETHNGQSGQWQYINSDTPAAVYPKPGEENSFDYSQISTTMTDPNGQTYTLTNPLPTVRTFCHYLVVLGVVVATIWMAMAATAVVMGERNGGSRVVGTAAGLMLLLMGYTIWKVIEINATKWGGIPDISQNIQRPQEALVKQGNLPQGPGTPIVPTSVPTSPNRSGIPVNPLAGN